MAKTATRRTRDAGRIVEVAQYVRAHRSDSKQVRAEKRKETTEVMKRFNKKTSVRKLELLLAANYVAGDNVCCVTYDDEHLPRSRAEAERRFRYYRDKLRKIYADRGVDIVVFWRTEHEHGDKRWHTHFVCTATGDDYQLLRDAWTYGEITEYRPLVIDGEDKNLHTLAVYLSKEAPDKLGQRSWSYTRNARKPSEDREPVDAHDKPQAPEGTKVLFQYSVETPSGIYYYVKYLLPDAPDGRRVHAKRRRRKAS